MDELLTILLDAEQITMPELADRLHMSGGIILARLERYEQLGYVRRIVEESSDGCSGVCTGCKGCGSHKFTLKPSVYWVKGKKLENVQI